MKFPTPHRPVEQAASSSRQRVWLLIASVVVCAFVWSIQLIDVPREKNGLGSVAVKDFCPQTSPLVPPPLPSESNVTSSQQWLLDSSFFHTAVQHLSDAIKIQTVSYDEFRAVPPKPIGTEDPSHAAFEELHAFLEATFPLVHRSLKKVVVNRYSLVYVWEGTDKELPPIVLMAHQDVVPVLPDTLDKWTHPPFDGYVDWEKVKIYGRGTSDVKQTFVAQMEAVELLLQEDFVPRATVLLCFGHDEEVSGWQGANKIVEYLDKEMGLAGKVGMIVDEGSGIGTFEGVEVAAVSVAEKGYCDVDLIVETKGGHSSVPPKHTAIGYSALLIAALEQNPFPISLPDHNPLLGKMRCYAAHAEDPDPTIVDLIQKWPASRENFAEYLAGKDARTEAQLTTSQAIDIINGGLKVNALPEKVVTTVNHRIAVDSGLIDVQTHYERVLGGVAKNLKLNFTVKGFLDRETVVTKVEMQDAAGSVTVFPRMYGIEPAPVSPSLNVNERGWRVLEGTIHHVFDSKSKSGRVVVVPSLPTGNTDTKHYWRLGNGIYRFGPGAGGKAHTVDEYALLSRFSDSIYFFHEVIRNWDSSFVE